jgi:hypothetical protein
MGGPWAGGGDRRPGRKRTVEECVTLAVGHLRGRVRPGDAGTLTWRFGDHLGRPAGAFAAGFAVAGPAADPTLTLRYRPGGGPAVELPLYLLPAPGGFGGVRWWFACPLERDGWECGRRVGALHLPPGGWGFGCRDCHALTYRSAQEAHAADRDARRFGYPPRVARLLFRIHRPRPDPPQIGPSPE